MKKQCQDFALHSSLKMLRDTQGPCARPGSGLRRSAPARPSLRSELWSPSNRGLASGHSCLGRLQVPWASPQLLNSVQHLWRTRTKQACTNHSQHRLHPDSSQVVLRCFTCINDVGLRLSQAHGPTAYARPEAQSRSGFTIGFERERDSLLVWCRVIL